MTRETKKNNDDGRGGGGGGVVAAAVAAMMAASGMVNESIITFSSTATYYCTRERGNGTLSSTVVACVLNISHKRMENVTGGCTLSFLSCRYEC